MEPARIVRVKTAHDELRAKRARVRLGPAVQQRSRTRELPLPPGLAGLAQMAVLGALRHHPA
jgi:hypothetical protein